MGPGGSKHGPPQWAQSGPIYGPILDPHGPKWGPYGELAEDRNHRWGRLTIFDYPQTNEKLPYMRVLHMYIYIYTRQIITN